MSQENKINNVKERKESLAVLSVCLFSSANLSNVVLYSHSCLVSLTGL